MGQEPGQDLGGWDLVMGSSGTLTGSPFSPFLPLSPLSPKSPLLPCRQQGVSGAAAGPYHRAGQGITCCPGAWGPSEELGCPHGLAQTHLGTSGARFAFVTLRSKQG